MPVSALMMISQVVLLTLELFWILLFFFWCDITADVFLASSVGYCGLYVVRKLSFKTCLHGGKCTGLLLAQDFG